MQAGGEGAHPEQVGQDGLQLGCIAGGVVGQIAAEERALVGVPVAERLIRGPEPFPGLRHPVELLLGARALEDGADRFGPPPVVGCPAEEHPELRRLDQR